MIKSIKVSTETYERLLSAGKMNESFNDLIARLLELDGARYRDIEKKD